MISARVDDVSSSVYASFMSEAGEMLMGMPVLQLKELKERLNYENISVRDHLQQERCYNTSFTLALKAQIDNYSQNSDETRFKYTVLKALPHNMKDESDMLLRRLRMYSKK